MNRFLFIISILFLTTLSARIISVKEDLYELNHLSRQQYEILIQTWRYAKRYNLQYTMTAIVWQESKFGKYLINLQDPSCGYFHKLLPIYAKELGLKPNNWNMSRVCQSLLNYDTSFMVALQTLQRKREWCKLKGYHGSMNWKCMIIAYNGWDKKGLKYYKNIVNKIRALKIWLDRKGIKGF